MAASAQVPVAVMDLVRVATPAAARVVKVVAVQAAAEAAPTTPRFLVAEK